MAHADILHGLLFHVKFLDIFIAFTSATLLFAYRCEQRPRFLLRVLLMFVPIRILCLVFAYSYGGSLELEILYSTILIVLMIAGLLFCYRDSFWNILFYFGSGFMTWYVADRTFLIIASLCSLSNHLSWFFVENTLSHIALYWVTFILVYLLIYSTVGRKLRKLGSTEIPPHNAILLILVVSILTPIFYFESSLVSKFNLFSYTLLNLGEIIYYISMLLVQIIMASSVKEKAEFITQQKLWLEEQKQYRLVKENIEAINIKCHDLKHQIRHLRDSEQVDPAYLDELEKSISIYNSSVRTGNETLDVVLTDKRLHCATNCIQFTCIAEGEKLGFMDVMDIYSLFGNALDNAIECESVLLPETRFIHLSVRAINQMLLIHIENHFEGTLHMDNGIPVTTKDNKDYHGYGMRSIKRIVEKYGGDFSVSTGDMLFQLNIMIPIPSELPGEQSTPQKRD